MKRGRKTDQFGRRLEVRAEVDQQDVRAQLPQANIQRLGRRIASQIREDLKGMGPRERRGESVRQLPVGSDQQRCQFG